MRLRDACDSLYSIVRTARAPGFALSNALRALGLPCGLKPANAHLALPAEAAARQLDTAFRRTLAMRVYLCPLDMSDDLPLLKFGPNRICKFTAAEHLPPTGVFGETVEGKQACSTVSPP
jgi:hypothetical protein